MLFPKFTAKKIDDVQHCFQATTENVLNEGMLGRTVRIHTRPSTYEEMQPTGFGERYPFKYIK